MYALPSVALIGFMLLTFPGVSAAGPFRSYNTELEETLAEIRAGKLEQAVTLIEKNNTDADKDILYFLEKGQLYSLSSNHTASRDTWLRADEIIQIWENDFRTDPGKLLGNIGSYLISDKTRRYDGQDYEKVLLSTRLTLNHILLGQFDHARIEMKKTYEREKLIESFREKEYDALKAETEKQQIGEVQKLDGYPMEELDTPEVRELKNGFQNAFAHYLAGYFFEVTDEPSLAEPGYRNALQLAPNKAIIQRSLENVGKRVPAPGESDVLFVVESGFAPRIESLNIPVPIPRQRGTLLTQLSFPVVKPLEPVRVPPTLAVAGQPLTVETLTNTDAMARRLLRDQMAGTILRTVVRATLKAVVQDQADKAHWIAGLIAKAVTVSTEQADDRSWRTLPERISVARANLPHGRHRLEFQTNAGTYSTEVDIVGRFAIVPIRLTSNAVFIAQPRTAGGDTQIAAVLQPAGPALPPPEAPAPSRAVPEPPSIPGSAASETPAAAPPPPTLIASVPPTLAPAAAPPSPPISAVSGKRVTVGDTTYIGDFRFVDPGGVAHGRGRVEWTNGDSYEGSLERGIKSGKGTFTSPSGRFRYEGDWHGDLQHGVGRTQFDDGDLYEGHMAQGTFHGQGRYVSKAGWTYDGEWKNGRKDGHGKITFPDGDTWEGLFADDQQTDQGKMSLSGHAENRPAPGPDAEPPAAATDMENK